MPSNEHKHRRIHREHHGAGPWPCYFCGDPVQPWRDDQDPRTRECVHHVNGDHSDDRPENLAAAHWACHSSGDAGPKGFAALAERLGPAGLSAVMAARGRMGHQALLAKYGRDGVAAIHLRAGRNGQAAYANATTPEQRGENVRRGQAHLTAADWSTIMRQRDEAMGAAGVQERTRRALAAIPVVQCPVDGCYREILANAALHNHLLAHERRGEWAM